MKTSTQVDYDASIRRVLLWLEANLTAEVTPARLASVGHFSTYHFHRIFRGMTGESVMQCVRRLRLESAALRLRHSAASVTEVAFEVGFDSHEGFTRAFRAHFGAPPSKWRREKSARAVQVQAASTLAPIDVEIRTTPPRQMICLRHQGSFAEIAQVWERFIGLALGAGLYTGSEQLTGQYPDDPDITLPGRVRYDVGLLSNTDAPVPPPLRRATRAGGRWAIALHKGSYSTLSETYLRLIGGAIPLTRLALADRPCVEVYLNSPTDTPDAELLTEVWAPIAD